MKLTRTALSMLLAKYRAVLKKCLVKNLAAGIMAGAAFLSVPYIQAEAFEV